MTDIRFHDLIKMFLYLPNSKPKNVDDRNHMRRIMFVWMGYNHFER